MEEIKRESAKEELCACRSAAASCSGSTHRYCFKRCCMLRCVALVLVLGAVFAAGVCAGGGNRHHGYGEYGRHGSYRGHMEAGMMGNQNYQYMSPEGSRVIMMQRTVGAVPAIVAATTSTTK